MIKEDTQYKCTFCSGHCTERRTNQLGSHMEAGVSREGGGGGGGDVCNDQH